jgi:AraC-like DNA-binding protein
MLSGAHKDFSDPDAYEQAVRAARVTGFVLNKAGKFKTSLQQMNLRRVWTQRGNESLARSAHVEVPVSRNAMIFLSDESRSPVVESGLELTKEYIVFYGRGVGSFQHTSGPTSWSSMSLAPEDLEEAGRLLLDRNISAPIQSARIRPRADALRNLRLLHKRANDLVRNQLAFAPHDEVARSMEADFIAAMMDCLDGDVDRQTQGYYRRLALIRQFRDWLELNNNRPVYLYEVCRALNVTARVLRSCCHEHFGVGPIRYLWLRRMALARRTLLHAHPGSSSVTEIAMNLGFWELGRFSVTYRSLYGERPTDTLARNSGR